MIRFLICEDEILELTSLQKIAEEHYGPGCHVETARTGDEALEIIVDYIPDIVFMDIHLGNWNGIELSKIILEEHPNTRIIIITAYDQFDYAQNAIKTGISDYLLKPIDTNTLIASIDKQLNILQEQRESLLLQTKLKRDYHDLSEMISFSFMNGIINNQLNDNFSAALMAMDISYKTAEIYILECDMKSFELSSNEIIILKKIIIDEILKIEKFKNVFFDIMRTKYIILCRFSDSNCEKTNIETARILRSNLISSLHIPVRIGISESVDDIKKLPAALKHAMMAIQNGEEIINSYSDYSFDQTPTTEIKNRVPNIVEAIIKTSPEGIVSLFEAIRNEYELNNIPFRDCKASYISLWISILQELISKISTISNYDEIQISTLNELMTAQNLTDISSVMINSCTKLISGIQQVIRNSQNYIANRAKTYIEQHYKENITLKSIAEALNISIYYLSHTFKKEFHTSVVEFITSQRINNACILLKQTDMSIIAIAEAVGYNDTNYFCRVFKKQKNLTPANFRHLDS